MFRAELYLFISAVLFVSACGGRAAESVQMIENGVLQNIPNSHSGCKWKPVQLRVFNDKTQSLRFNHLQCPQYKGGPQFGYKVRWTIKNGNVVTALRYPLDLNVLDISPSGVMVIWKLGAMSEQEFMEGLIPATSLNCAAGKDSKGIWRLGVSEAYLIKAGMLVEGPIEYPYDFYENCNPLSSPDWRYIVRDGIVFGYDWRLAENYFYDINSVVYENRG